MRRAVAIGVALPATFRYHSRLFTAGGSMAQQYLPGQRWISDSEAELGLGTILTQDGRMLTVLYPATGETRQYATRSAPLTRVRFVPETRSPTSKVGR